MGKVLVCAASVLAWGAALAAGPGPVSIFRTFAFQEPGEGWRALVFDDAAWKSGTPGSGNRALPPLRRAEWQNLNGTSQFAIDREGKGRELGYPWGVDLPSQVRVPRGRFGRRVRLHFGVVDATDAHVDGWAAGVVLTDDPDSGPPQARGKQSDRRESYGCIDTRTTGIWQTVYLDLVSGIRLETYARLRTIAIDGPRVLPNGRSIFQRLVPDEGFDPDGIYTAPSDGDLRRDMERGSEAPYTYDRKRKFDPAEIQAVLFQKAAIEI